MPDCVTLPAPAFDEQGNPTDAFLDGIREAEPRTPAEAARLVRLVASLWKCPELIITSVPDIYVFTTVGWSSDMALIEALSRNEDVIEMCQTVLSLSGLLYIFVFSDEHADSLSDHVGDWVAGLTKEM